MITLSLSLSLSHYAHNTFFLSLSLADRTWVKTYSLSLSHSLKLTEAIWHRGTSLIYYLRLRKNVLPTNKRTKEGGRQCDQIGRFLKVLGNIFCHQSSPNIWKCFVYYVVCHFFKKNCFDFFLGNNWKIWITFNSNIWSHWREGKKRMCAEKERGERERVILGAPNDRQGRGARERERECVWKEWKGQWTSLSIWTKTGVGEEVWTSFNDLLNFLFQFEMLGSVSKLALD